MKKTTTYLVILDGDDLRKAIVSYVNCQRNSDNDPIFTLDHIDHLIADGNGASVSFTETEL